MLRQELDVLRDHQPLYLHSDSDDDDASSWSGPVKQANLDTLTRRLERERVGKQKEAVGKTSNTPVTGGADAHAQKAGAKPGKPATSGTSRPSTSAAQPTQPALASTTQQGAVTSVAQQAPSLVPSHTLKGRRVSIEVPEVQPPLGPPSPSIKQVQAGCLPADLPSRSPPSASSQHEAAQQGVAPPRFGRRSSATESTAEQGRLPLDLARQTSSGTDLYADLLSGSASSGGSFTTPPRSRGATLASLLGRRGSMEDSACPPPSIKPFSNRTLSRLVSLPTSLPDSKQGGALTALGRVEGGEGWAQEPPVPARPARDMVRSTTTAASSRRSYGGQTLPHNLVAAISAVRSSSEVFIPAEYLPHPWPTSPKAPPSRSTSRQNLATYGSGSASSLSGGLARLPSSSLAQLSSLSVSGPPAGMSDLYGFDSGQPAIGVSTPRGGAGGGVRGGGGVTAVVAGSGRSFTAAGCAAPQHRGSKGQDSVNYSMSGSGSGMDGMVRRERSITQLGVGPGAATPHTPMAARGRRSVPLSYDEVGVAALEAMRHAQPGNDSGAFKA